MVACAAPARGVLATNPPFGLRVPMIAVSSLDLLAFPVRFSNRLIVTAIDARRGELYYAFYRQVPGGVQRLGDHQLGTPDDLASELIASADEVLLVGDGAAHRLASEVAVQHRSDETRAGSSTGAARHAGTAAVDGQVRTSGGRVLCVTALGENVKLAQRRAYEVLAQISWDGMQYRKDIGHRAISR